jgi:hypothetical protein
MSPPLARAMRSATLTGALALLLVAAEANAQYSPPCQPGAPGCPGGNYDPNRGEAFRGAARGATRGAVIGGITGDAGRGAARGAALGGIFGAARRAASR